jgi:hypothetical protein
MKQDDEELLLYNNNKKIKFICNYKLLGYDTETDEKSELYGV